jgi:hypothetical protein
MGDGKRIEMGAVRIGATDPFRESLIGFAPLLTGTCAVLYVASRRLGVEILSPPVISELPARVTQYLSARDAGVWIYLIFAISNAMLPSGSDRRPWGSLLLYAGVIALLFYFVGGVTRVPEEMVGLGLALVRYLSWAFGLTLVVDLLVMLMLLLVEGVIWISLGRRLG